MIIKKPHLVFLFLILLAFHCHELYAQDQMMRPSKKNQFYLELGGNAIIYSFNYERMITDNFSLRGGIGISPTLGLVEGTFIFIPITGSFLLGSNTSKLEIGLGVTYFSGKETEFFSYEVDSETKSKLFITGILGYRYVSSGGFIFRVAFTPLYNPDKTEDSKFLPWGALSFGYAF